VRVFRRGWQDCFLHRALRRLLRNGRLWRTGGGGVEIWDGALGACSGERGLHFLRRLEAAIGAPVASRGRRLVDARVAADAGARRSEGALRCLVAKRFVEHHARLTDPVPPRSATPSRHRVGHGPTTWRPAKRRHERRSPRDIYSVGVMLYEALCHETPQGAFDLPSARIGCDRASTRSSSARMQQAPIAASNRRRK